MKYMDQLSLIIDKHETGNALFIILIAIALFAALTYAVTESSRSGNGNISQEKMRLDQAEIDNYTVNISTAVMRLQMAGCRNIDYTPPADQNPLDDPNCFVFHPHGGGAYYRDLGLGVGCLLEELTAIGDRCGGVVYAGENGGHRIYTTEAASGSSSWNNGDNIYQKVGAYDNSDGLINTETLLTAISSPAYPYLAAQMCRSLGPKWYLPSPNELQMMFTNKTAIGGFFNTGSDWHWTSRQSFDDGHVAQVDMKSGAGGNNGSGASVRRIRCTRRD